MATAEAPIPKATPNPGGGLREIPLRGMRSAEAAAESRRISPDDARTLPVKFKFEQEDMASYLTVDANGDGTCWKYEKDYSLGGTACYESMTATAGADDWLILPFVDFNVPSGSYAISLQAKKLVKPESFDICISPTTDIADAKVMASFSDEITSPSFGQLSAEFNVPSPGKYCVMIHATSPEKGLSLNVTNVEISANASEGFTVPFAMTPEPDEARHFKFIDVNDDGKTWFYDTSNKGLSYEYHATNPADDYALFPEIIIPEPGNYKFTWTPRAYGTSLESMEVLIGLGDNPSTFTTVWTEPMVSSTIYPREVVIRIPEAGAWRPALHCSSAANRYKLLVKDFTLDATDESPAEALPMTMAGPLDVTSASPAASKAFLLPEAARVKIEFKHQGAPMAVGLGNAPHAAASTELFTVEASQETTAVSKILNLTGPGIRYLVFTSEGEAQLTDLNVRVFTEEDEAYQLPFSIQPTEEQFQEFTVVNSNKDASTWTYYADFDAARYNYSATEKADDWLVTPAINVPSTDAMLTFSFNVRGMGKSFPETFEIWSGSTPDISRMEKLYTSPEVRNEQFTPYSVSFAPSHKGLTYMAIRATSEPKMFHIFVRDLELKADGRSVAVARPVSDLKAEGLPEGSTDAKVTFTMPSYTEGGAAIDAAATLTAEVKSSSATVTLSGAPGQSMECTIANGQGEGEISVVVINEAGRSNAAVTTVFTGQHRPAAVADLKAEADATNRIATLTWSLSEEGIDGGYVDPAQVTYTIRHAAGSGSYTKIGTTDGTCTFSYTIPDSYPQEMHYFTVTASNAAGDGPEPQKGLGLVMGKPHAIPSTEDFSDGSITLGPVGMSYPDDTYTLDWYFDNPANAFDEAANNSSLALIAFTENDGAARGRLHLPKFDTRTDKGARVVLRLFNFPHFAPTDVYGSTYDTKDVRIGRIEPSENAGWTEYSLPLPENLLNKEWVEIYLDFGFDGSHDDEIWMLDRYGMENYHEVELDLRAATTHSRVKANEKTDWRFIAGNYGRTDITFTVPTLNFTTEDGDVMQFDAVESAGKEITLKPGETVGLRYEPVADTALEGDGAFDIEIPVEGDGNPANNSVADAIKVWTQKEYVVRDLTATRDNDNNQDEVTLSWSAPSADYGILYVDNLDSWDMGDQLGLFTNYDGDGIPTMMFVGASYPGMGKAKAWQVFDYEDAGFDYRYAGYLGTAKSLIAFGPGDGKTKADDWLISPEVKGSTELTFYLRPLHYAYGHETVEVLTSSTGNRPGDFTLLTTYNTKDGDAEATPYWEEVVTTLPADARYFAIRYVSCNIFGLQLDDVIFTPAQGVDDALTYTVMRDGETIATGVKETAFTDTFAGSATYHVAAEKAYGGLHPLSNRAMVAVSGIGTITEGSTLKVTTGNGTMTIVGTEGMTLSVVAADGTLVYNTDNATAETTLTLPTGLYIVTAEGHAPVKAIVK